MHMQPLVSPVWSKPLVESTQTIFPRWHLNPVGSESCSFLYPQEQRKMGPFCFHVASLSFTLSGFLKSSPVHFWLDMGLLAGCVQVFWLGSVQLHVFSLLTKREALITLLSPALCVMVPCPLPLHVPCDSEPHCCSLLLAPHPRYRDVYYWIYPLWEAQGFIFSQSHLLFSGKRVRRTFVAFLKQIKIIVLTWHLNNCVENLEVKSQI